MLVLIFYNTIDDKKYLHYYIISFASIHKIHNIIYIYLCILIMTTSSLQSSYTFTNPSILLGKAKIDDIVNPTIEVRIPLKMLNKHGLIAWATGTGKTKTLQLFCEQLSNEGIPSVVMDIKGDFSGIAAPWNATHPKILERYEQLEMDYVAQAFSTEFFTLDGSPGAQLKTTVIEFGPLLMSKVLDCNDTQSGMISVLFHIADDLQLPLLNLQDLKTFINRVMKDGKDKLSAYGTMSSTSLSTILRKIIALESQWGEMLFAEPSFDIHDRMTTDRDGRWMVNVIRLMSMQDKPMIFATFMLGLLAELFEQLPEIGDPEKPKLVMIIDEAHLMFQNANKTLLQQIETTIKLIRSKGVGIYFCTQVPGDIPDIVLSQLGTKIQHSLRAFTAKDHETIQKAVKNYPISDIYDLSTLITSMGIGEAMISTLDEKARPTPVAHTFLCTPASRMDIITDDELDTIVSKSRLASFYNKIIDSDSAHEILVKQIGTTTWDTKQTSWHGRSFDNILKSKFATTIFKSAANTVVRGVFEKLGIKVDKRRNFF